MTFTYTKTVEVDFSTIIPINNITDFITDILCDNLDYEICFEDEQAKVFEEIQKEAFRYVATELNNLVE